MRFDPTSLQRWHLCTGAALHSRSICDYPGLEYPSLAEGDLIQALDHPTVFVPKSIDRSRSGLIQSAIHPGVHCAMEISFSRSNRGMELLASMMHDRSHVLNSGHANRK